MVFSVVAWRFFAARIHFEERLLLDFFGPAYASYAARVPTWCGQFHFVAVARPSILLHGRAA